jgi:thiamine pyrophosphate-dependent acetolactate synthase large subunit-like protein
MPLLSGGAWAVEALRAEGVRHVFGIPGVHNLAVYDALLGQSAITHVLARHEASAAFMADGYARASGQPGVVLVTTGPGATYTLTALAESYGASVPVVVLMSDIASPLVGRDLGALHEVPDQIACFRPVCRLAEAVGEARAIAPTIAGAFDLLRSGRPGPVAISVPHDLLAARVEAEARPGGHGRRPPCRPEDVDAAARLLRAARRPLIVAGGGVVAAGGEAALAAVARRLQAPVVTSVGGRGVISERDPLWQGVLADRRAVADALRAADAILVAGCRLGHRSLDKLGVALEPARGLVHLDVDPTVIGRMARAAIAMVGDARDGLERLAAALGPGPSAAGWDRAWLAVRRADAGPRWTPALATLVDGLRDALPDDAIVACDQTGLTYWMEWRFPVLAPRTFLYPTTSAALGYGLPAALGAAIARPDRAVVCVAGDGGFMYSVAELATAVKYRLPVVTLVLNDHRFGAIAFLQQRLYGRTGEADLANPDFVALGRAFGAHAERVERPEGVADAVRRALAVRGPSLLELPLAIEPPWDG